MVQARSNLVFFFFRHGLSGGLENLLLAILAPVDVISSLTSSSKVELVPKLAQDVLWRQVTRLARHLYHEPRRGSHP